LAIEVGFLTDNRKDPRDLGFLHKLNDVIFGDIEMKKIVLAAMVAVFAFAAHANDKATVAPATPAAKQMSAEECTKALVACGEDAACKSKITAENPNCVK
jgi:hypothetical protein